MLILGSGEIVQSIHVHDKVIVSMTGNNRVAWHSLTDKEVNTLCFDKSLGNSELSSRHRACS